MKNVLVLGAGFVTRPLVGYLLERGYRVTCASRTLAKAEKLIAGHANGSAHALDLNDEQKLKSFIAECDLAVSLVPFAFHPTVAGLCIEHRKPMVTTSYVSPEMEELDGAAREAGVTVLNEIGVDPGIDHMSAMRVIDGVKGRGGRITAFRSYCGGLPAPEANDNPFGYKFSWAPRGVLVAALRPARYLWQGEEIVVPDRALFEHVRTLDLGEDGIFETYPNADAIACASLYGIEVADTVYRGTLRYPATAGRGRSSWIWACWTTPSGILPG